MTNGAPDPFDAAIAFTLQAEGGLTDNPNDPGGLTNLGLTLADMTAWEGHTASAADVRNLTVAEATNIYRALYWAPVNGARLPVGVGLMVFDHGVNRGVGTSARILQRIVGATADGVIGPLTLSATTFAVYNNVEPFLEQLYEAQRADYLALANPTFENGWLNRCAARFAAAKTAAGVTAPTAAPTSEQAALDLLGVSAPET